MSRHYKYQKYAMEDENDSDEESDGTDSIKVIDNHIYFYSEVSVISIMKLTELIKKATNKYLFLNIQLNIETELYLHINSGGGDVFAVLSIINLIHTNKLNINTIIEGQACSAATILSMVGSKRQITENSYMLIHNISSEFWGKMHEFEDEMKNLTLLTKDLRKMYSKYSNIKATQLDKLLKKDLLLNAKTCLSYGFVDEII